MTTWQKSIGLTVGGVLLLWGAIAASVCSPALHLPVVIASISVVTLVLGLVWNVRANKRETGFNVVRFALLGTVQICMLCFEVWVLARTNV